MGTIVNQKFYSVLIEESFVSFVYIDLHLFQDFVPNSLVELDLTGFPSVSSSSLSPDSSYAKTIKNLRCKGINVIEDQTHFDTKELTWKKTIVYLFDGKEEHPLNLGGGNSCLRGAFLDIQVFFIKTCKMFIVFQNCMHFSF